MRSIKYKILLALVAIGLLVVPFLGSAQTGFVQPYTYKDNSFPWFVNIGNGALKTTHAAAYLEVGPASGATKGLLIPRGSIASIANPTAGLVIYDIPSGKLAWYNGSQWITAITSISGESGSGGSTIAYQSPIILDNGTVKWQGNTTNVPEGTNLYFTTARVRAITDPLYLAKDSFTAFKAFAENRYVAVPRFLDSLAALRSRLLLAVDTQSLHDQIATIKSQLSTVVSATDTTTNLHFINGLYKNPGTTDVGAKYWVPMWNTNAWQGFSLEPGQPLDGQTYIFNAASGKYELGFPVGTGGTGGTFDPETLFWLAQSGDLEVSTGSSIVGIGDQVSLGQKWKDSIASKTSYSEFQDTTNQLRLAINAVLSSASITGKIQPGYNTTFTGSGTTADPYYVHAKGYHNGYGLLMPNDSTFKVDTATIFGAFVEKDPWHIDSVRVTGTTIKTVTNYYHNGTSYSYTYLDQTGTSGTGSVTSGSISWPGILFNSPTNATVSGGALLFNPTLASQAAYSVLGNHTSGSATPTFGKLKVQSIDATGSTYDGTKYLKDNGTWGPVTNTELDPLSVLNRSYSAATQTASFNVSDSGKIGKYLFATRLATPTFQLTGLTADPTTGLTNGQAIYNTTTNTFRGYKSGAWQDFAMTGDFIQNQIASTQVAGFKIGKDANTFITTNPVNATLVVSTNDQSLGGISISKPLNANGGAALSIASQTSATGGFQFLGGSSSGFLPTFRLTGDAVQNGTVVSGMANSDAGTGAALQFDARSPTGTTLATKPLFTWTSAGAIYMQMKPGGKLILGPTSTLATTAQTSGEQLQVNGNVFVSGDISEMAGTHFLRLATPVQNAPVINTTGGSLGSSAANLLFRVVAVDFEGNTGIAESAAASTTAIITSGTTTQSVSLSWPAIYGAAGYRVYVTTNSWGATANYYTTATNSYVYTGSATPVANNAVPIANTSSVTRISSVASSVFSKGCTFYEMVNLATPFTPTGSSDATGITGDVARDDNYLYLKTSGGWKRTALSSF
jgi:hypothetical protein